VRKSKLLSHLASGNLPPLDNLPPHDKEVIRQFVTSAFSQQSWCISREVPVAIKLLELAVLERTTVVML
jgi:hypothetical protein